MSIATSKSFAPAANTPEEMLIIPSTIKFATVAIDFCNTGNTDAAIKIAISPTAVPGIANYIEYGMIVAANGGSLTRTCQLVVTGERVIVESSTGNVSFRVTTLGEPM